MTVDPPPLDRGVAATATRTERLARLAVVAAVGVAPIGVFGPWQPVWVVTLGLSLLAIAVRPPPASIVTQAAPLLVFVGLLAASLLWSSQPSAGRGIVFAVATWAAVYLATRSVLRSDDVLPPVQTPAIVWLTVLAALLTLHAVFEVIPNDLEDDSALRHAAMAATGLLVLAFTGSRRRGVAAALGAAALAATALTGSRTATVATMVVLLGAAFIRFRRTARVALPLLIGVVVVAALVVSPIEQRWFDLLETDVDGAATVDLGTRSEVWSSVASSCRPDPFFGRGAGTADVLANDAHSGYPDPHNSYLRVFCDTGVAGSVLLWGFFLGVLLRAAAVWRQGRGRSVAGAALLGVGVVLIYGLVWNPITAVEFMAPLAVVFAFADHIASRVVPALGVVEPSPR